MKNLLALVCLSLFVSVAGAQETETEETPVVQSNPTSILLLINESQPQQVIVYDSAGKWLSDVKKVEVTVDLLGGGIMAKCTSWKGIFKPANPKVASLTVKEIKSVTAEQFQTRLESLNEGD